MKKTERESSAITQRRQEAQYTRTHGRNVYGWYKPSPVTIMNWKTEKAKLILRATCTADTTRGIPQRCGTATTLRCTTTQANHTESRLHRRYVTWRETLTKQSMPHSTSSPPTTKMTWPVHGEKLAVKWQEKLAMRTEDKLVIFKLVRNDEDPKLSHFHVHKDYYDVVYDT